MDPASVRDRHEMYRLLVERGNPHGALGEGHELSPFWGYDSQLAWQHASGRLNTDGSDRIAHDSWWGACNYSLSVVPYAVAMEHELVPRAELDVRAYATALPHWHGAFHRMVAIDAEADLEPMRFAVWRAHYASIQIAVARHRREFDLLPPSEQAFVTGWIRMVDLFTTCGMRTDREYLTARPASLPSRLLRDRDVSDLPRYEASTARRVIALGDRPAWRWPLELAMWKRMVRKRAARDDLDTVMIELFGKSLRGKLRALRRAI